MANIAFSSRKVVAVLGHWSTTVAEQRMHSIVWEVPMLKETQHLLIGCLSIGLFPSMFGCVTQGDLKALREESRNESATIQRALTGRIDQTNRQLDAQKQILEEQQHALSELRTEMLTAGNLQKKLDEMQRHETAQQ